MYFKFMTLNSYVQNIFPITIASAFESADKVSVMSYFTGTNSIYEQYAYFSYDFNLC